MTPLTNGLERTAVALDPSRLDEIGDLLDVGILGVDDAMVVRSWNRWMELASGRSSDEVVGRPLRAAFPDLSDFAENAIRQATSGLASVMSQRFHKFVLRMAPPAGYEQFSAMQQSARIAPHVGVDGAIVGALVLIEDVTERVAGEAQLRDALAHAEAANRVKADFLASMSHELRTPIGAMSGYADLLADGLFGPVTPEQVEPLHRIKAVGAHLLGIVEEILVFSRVEAGRENVRPVEAEASALLTQAVNAVAPLAIKKGLRLEYVAPDAPIPMLADPVKVGQVLINLLANAVKFTSEGAVTVSLAQCDDGAAVQFIVRDSGEGIPAKDLERIFEPFTQVESALSRRREGTGLGLAVSRQLARLLGGDVTVMSEVGVGSTFVTTLPVRSIDTAAEESLPA